MPQLLQKLGEVLCMNKTNYTRPVKYRCNECRRAKGWEK